MENKIKIKNKAGLKGKFRFLTYKAGTKELVRQSDWVENLVMKDTDTGINLIAQRIIGSKTYDIEVTSASIGTGNTAPTENDTDLETPVTEDIVRANQTVQDTSTAVLLFFISDAELPDGTYEEFGLFCDTQLFARALISPSYTKGTSEDTIVEYHIIIDNA